ncbi:MAG: GIY-YIG nuclease family protein [Zoogloeaceae bacterium]|jgi:predicted GIY-YIG superfamily endonuclease|nr:GIY-YIG nuclease family protein [Zoogloeaceae bacterium]
MNAKPSKQYIYIVQSSKETKFCKIGITESLDRRLKDYNNMTGKSQDNVYEYLFTCEVKNMRQVERDIKAKFSHLREEKNKEIYFYNSPLFQGYVDFIKSHKMFVKEVYVKPEAKKTVVKIVKKTTPTLQDRGLSRKDVMQKAKKANNDEFYTRYEDIEREISMYDKKIWKNKVVFCNCDDAVGDEPRNNNNTSAFALFFINNFLQLKLKKLICTHYSGALDLFNTHVKGYVFTKDGFQEIKEYPAGYTGSFDDPLSVRILNEEADIVSTNPPFSRAGDYWKLLIDSGKKFLIVSNITNVKNQPYMSYFEDKKVWAGYNRIDKYLNPKMESVEASGHWYTNLQINNRPKYGLLKIVPLKEIPNESKRYDDNKTLVVDNCFIPNDYDKPFAVSARPILNGILEKGYQYAQNKEYVPYIENRRCFGRILIKKV